MNTISIAPATKGQVTAASTDGHSFLTTAPLLDGARYWLEKDISPDIQSSSYGPQAPLTGPSGAPSAQLQNSQLSPIP
jgi:hypothetical protein